MTARELLRAAAHTVRSPIAAAPGLMAAHTLVNVVVYAAQVPAALGLKLTLDGITRGSVSAALVGVLVGSGSSFFQFAAVRLSLGMQFALDEHHMLHTDQRLARIVGDPPGLLHLESPAFLDHHALFAEKRRLMAMTSKNLTALVGLLVSLVPTLYLLGRIHPLLLLLPAFGVASLFVGGYATVAKHSLDTRLAESQRLQAHLFTHLTSPQTGKEIRVSGLADELMGRMRRAADEVERRQGRHQLRVGGLTLLTDLVYVVGYSGAVLLVLQQALHGYASAGDVALVVALGLRVNGQVTGTADSLRVLADGIQAASHELALRDHHDQEMARHAGRRRLPPARLDSGIALEHVCFRYPGTERHVLTDMDVLLPAGSIVALVGDNGAGKTTLVKLVCGFYEPTAGRILLDDADLGGIDLLRWRQRISAAFQDFALLELTARQAVGVGDLPRVDDDAAVRAALERAGGHEVLHALPRGLATQIGASFAEGRQLSGGQWQMVALGRSLMRESPLLLVLDEPTASLDPDAERRLFDRHVAAARRARTRSGSITLLVSHRFSTVRNADLVLVMDGGRLVERGGHDELVRRGGLYAEMYELQARAYRG